MVRNICRAITFYNNYIPPMESKDVGDFVAFGAVDCIKVEKIPGFDMGFGENVLKKIWKYQRDFFGSMEEPYSVQQIYAIRKEEESEEESFWGIDLGMPFFFFCRLQFATDDVDLVADRKKIEKTIQSNYSDEKDNFRILTYLTYDNTDLMIILRTKEYRFGTEVINELHKNLHEYIKPDCRLKNSFSIMAVQRDWLNNLTDEDIAKLNQSVIEYVSIKFMERGDGDIDNILAHIPSIRFLDTPILGTDDRMVVFRGIGWGDFLQLYREKDGIFHNCDNSDADKKSYIYNAASVMTTLIVNLSDNGKKKNVEHEGNQDNKDNKDNERWEKTFQYKCMDLCEQFKSIKDNPVGDNPVDDKKELGIVLNTLRKFSGKVFNDYIFMPLMDAMDTLLKLMAADNMDQFRQEFFLKFMRGFVIYTQSNSLSDRHAAQALGFNTRIYDIPAKLSAFFNAYLYEIVQILNTYYNPEKKITTAGTRNYVFIAFPGMSKNINVVELYKQELKQQRLMQVEIPEYGYYAVPETMLILAHEAAHYVGSMIRNRTLRSELILNSYAHLYIKYMKYFIHRESSYDFFLANPEDWDCAEERMRIVLSDYIEKMRNMDYIREERTIGLSDEHLKKLKKMYNDPEYARHFPQMEMDFREAMMEIVQFELDNVFWPVVFQQLDSEKQIFYRLAEDASWRFLTGDSMENVTLATSDNVFHGLEMLYKESFSDVISIEMLDVKLEDYLCTLISNAKEQGMKLDVFSNSDVLLRIAAVILCKYKSEETSEEKDKWLRFENDESGQTDWKILGNSALRIIYCASKEGIPVEDSYANLLVDKVILKDVAMYLQECLKGFKTVMSAHEKELESIKNIYNVFSGTAVSDDSTCRYDAEKEINLISSFIMEYRDKLMKKWQDEKGTKEGLS